MTRPVGANILNHINVHLTKRKESPVFGPSHEKVKIVLNLWAYADEQGYVQRLAGRCYALHGSDEEKLAVLRVLSRSDYLTAEWRGVPKNYGLINADGSETLGVSTANEALEPHSCMQLFGSLIDHLESKLPEQLIFFASGYERLTLKIPKDPLMIRTIVIERPDGQLIPLINSADEISSLVTR